MCNAVFKGQAAAIHRDADVVGCSTEGAQEDVGRKLFASNHIAFFSRESRLECVENDCLSVHFFSRPVHDCRSRALGVALQFAHHGEKRCHRHLFELVLYPGFGFGVLRNGFHFQWYFYFGIVFSKIQEFLPVFIDLGFNLITQFFFYKHSGRQVLILHILWDSRIVLGRALGCFKQFCTHALNVRLELLRQAVGFFRFLLVVLVGWRIVGFSS